jgi:ABC-type multidrug transport system fused ATPase/permease subunit
MRPFVVIYRLLTPRRRLHLIVTFTLSLVAAVAEVLTIGAVVPFLALITRPPRRLLPGEIPGWLHLGSGVTLPYAALMLAGAAIMVTVIRLLLLASSQRLVLRLGQEINIAIFHRILAQSYVQFTSRNSSELLAGIEKVQRVVANVLQPLIQGTIATLLAAAIFVILFAIHPGATLIAGGVVLTAYGIIFVAKGRRLKSNSSILARGLSARTKLMQEAIGGFRDIVLSRSKAEFESRYAQLESAHRTAQARNAFIAASPRFVLEGAGIAAVAAVTVLLSLERGALLYAIPILGALALGAQRLLPLVQQIYFGWSQFFANHDILADVTALLEMPIDEATEGEQLPAPSYLFRSIEVRTAGVRYPDGTKALSDVTLNLKKGERLGIVGPTGSGKSTLLDLMMGLLEPSEGQVLVNGHALNGATRVAWSGQVAHVPQHIYLADTSVASNIAFGIPSTEVDQGRVREAARLAQLDAFIDTLPEGYNSRVGELGIRISGGQRQRIGIARALYRRADILFLDEATNALDEATEAAVIEALSGPDRRFTVVMIAHRLSSLSLCDRIISLSSGRIAGPA